MLFRKKSVSSHLQVGADGEDAAVKYLKKQGLKILERNVRIPGGEIDIIARDRQFLVFVEVKTSTQTAFGNPENWVTPRKQKQLGRLAAAYLQRQKFEDQDCRFDVVGVRIFNGNKPVVTHLENAFVL